MTFLRSFFIALGLTALLSLSFSPSEAQTASSAYGGNLLINPWMETDILNEGSATTVTSTAAATFTYGGGGTVAAFTAGIFDGWGMTDATTSASNTVSMQNAAIAPNGSVSDLLFTIGTGSATRTDQQLITLEQRVEPFRIAPLQYGTANAQTSYLSFCAKASIAGNYSFYIAGGLAARTSDIPAGTSGSAYFHIFNIPTAAQWACYQFPIPGDTGGTWLATTNTVDATHGATLGFVMDLVGAATHIYSTPSATQADGVWQNLTNTGAQAQVIGNGATQVLMGKTSGATFELTGVRWALDSNPLQHQPELELLQAQRYRQKTYSYGVAGLSGIKPRQNLGVAAAQGYVSASIPVTSLAVQLYWPFAVPMRASPTMITFSPGAATSACYDINGAAAGGAVTIELGITGNVAPLNSVTISCAATADTAGDRIGVGAFADAHL